MFAFNPSQCQPTVSHANYPRSRSCNHQRATVKLSVGTMTSCSVYLATVNAAYLFRRAVLHNKSPLRLLRTHLSRDGMKFPLFIACILSWQVFAAFYPPLELVCRATGHASFFFYYPNACGAGIVVEPLAIVSSPYRVRRKQQIRLDFHRFTLNTGPVSRNGYRHPPTKAINRPHIDMPSRNLKHWPWRRRMRNIEDTTPNVKQTAVELAVELSPFLSSSKERTRPQPESGPIDDQPVP